jgi:hypothetical protein
MSKQRCMRTASFGEQVEAHLLGRVVRGGTSECQCDTGIEITREVYSQAFFPGATDFAYVQHLEWFCPRSELQLVKE